MSSSLCCEPSSPLDGQKRLRAQICVTTYSDRRSGSWRLGVDVLSSGTTHTERSPSRRWAERRSYQYEFSLAERRARLERNGPTETPLQSEAAAMTTRRTPAPMLYCPYSSARWLRTLISAIDEAAAGLCSHQWQQAFIPKLQPVQKYIDAAGSIPLCSSAYFQATTRRSRFTRSCGPLKGEKQG